MMAGIESGHAWAQPALHWVICGGESGPDARPMHPDWARSIRDQCEAAGVAFFFKQWGAYAWAPDDLNFEQALRWNAIQIPGGSPYLMHSDGRTVFRVGKKRAGRLLDGVEHNAMPARCASAPARRERKVVNAGVV
jgi:Protein of unknown function (DUF5131)